MLFFSAALPYLQYLCSTVSPTPTAEFRNTTVEFNPNFSRTYLPMAYGRLSLNGVLSRLQYAVLPPVAVGAEINTAM